MLSVLSGSLKFFRSQICSCHYEMFYSMFLDLSMEHLNIWCGVAICEIHIFKLSTMAIGGQIKSNFVSKIKNSI
jgi:hypothetical protein